MDCQSDGRNPTIKKLQMWSDGETRLLLDKYGHYLPEIGPLKKFKNKKQMWERISTELQYKNANQCEERYKTIIRRKKPAVENNNTSGAKRQKADFEEELEQICKMDEIQMSSQRTVRKVFSEEYFAKVEKKKVTSVQNTLIEIAERKEEARERRHRENMEFVNKIHSLLTKMLEEEDK